MEDILKYGIMSGSFFSVYGFIFMKMYCVKTNYRRNPHRPDIQSQYPATADGICRSPQRDNGVQSYQHEIRPPGGQRCRQNDDVYQSDSVTPGSLETTTTHNLAGNARPADTDIPFTPGRCCGRINRHA